LQCGECGSGGVSLDNKTTKYIILYMNLKLFPSEEMSPKLEKLIAEVETDIKKNGLSPAFNTVEDFIANLKQGDNES
jgi:hypothetical protein